MNSRQARRLVRLYPRAWRERYEEEFVVLLEQRQMALSDLLDVRRPGRLVESAGEFGR